jgi:hypothetical protein
VNGVHDLLAKRRRGVVDVMCDDVAATVIKSSGNKRDAERLSVIQSDGEYGTRPDTTINRGTGGPCQTKTRRPLRPLSGHPKANQTVPKTDDLVRPFARTHPSCADTRLMLGEGGETSVASRLVLIG